MELLTLYIVEDMKEVGNHGMGVDHRLYNWRWTLIL